MKKLFYLIISFSLFNSDLSFAKDDFKFSGEIKIFAKEENIEVRRLYKCYALFLDERIKENDPLLLDVKSKKISGTDACMKLLERAQLSASGVVANEQTGSAVLRNFVRFYRGEFISNNFATSGGGSGTYSVTSDITDRNEPLYHYAYALFKKNEPFSKLVTRNHSFKAIRKSSKSERTRTIASVNSNNLHRMNSGDANRCKSLLELTCDEAKEFRAPLTNAQNLTINNCLNVEQYKSYCDNFIWEGSVAFKNDPVALFSGYIPNLATTNPAIPFYPEFVETGKLIGIERDDRVSEVTITASMNSFNSKNIHEHHGAGAIGTQAYLLGNMSFLTGALNGTTKVQRRFGVNVFSDFLCRPNPALRSTDVIDEVIATSPIPFRQGISCMGCHAGMDKLAGVARTVTLIGSHNSGVRPGRVGFMGKRVLTQAQEAQKVMLGTTSNISNYHLTAPVGQLNYRSYDGTRVQVELESLEDLGQKISETNDFYVCAAKRHFKFLTGIEVNLDDEGDMNAQKLTKTEQFYRDRVIKLGLDLKKHQSLNDLLRAIISSPTFVHPDRGV